MFLWVNAVLTEFLLSGKSGNVKEFCFSWNVREFSQKMAMPINAVAFHFAVPMGRGDHYDLGG